MTPIIHLAGSPEQMGLAHGRALGDQIRELRAGLERYIIDARPRRQAFAFRNAAVALARVIERNAAPRHRRELRAIARGAELPLSDVLLITGFDDILNLLRPLGGRAALGCSCAVLGPTDALVHARGLDYYLPASFTPYGPEAASVMRAAQTVFVIDGDGVAPLVSVGWPGYGGVVTGWNGHGISLGSLTPYLPAGWPRGVPSGLLYRQALEVSSTIDDVLAIVTIRGCMIGNNLSLVQGSAGAWAIAEIAPHRPPRVLPGVRVATNHFTALDLAAEQRGDVPQHSWLRASRLEQLAGHAAGRELLLDSQALGPGAHDAIDNQGTVQSVVFHHASAELELRDWATEGWERLPLPRSGAHGDEHSVIAARP